MGVTVLLQIVKRGGGVGGGGELKMMKSSVCNLFMAQRRYFSFITLKHLLEIVLPCLDPLCYKFCKILIEQRDVSRPTDK